MHRPTFHRPLALLCALGVSAAVSGQMGRQGGAPMTEPASQMLDKRGTMVPRDIELTDSRGYPVKLSQFFPGDRPVLLNLGYFGCPSLCGQVLNAMADGLDDVDLTPGEDFTILSISINPEEKPDLAASKKRAYLNRYRRPEAEQGWMFCVGDGEQTQRLADAVGFPFRWSDATQQYAHPAAIVFLSPEGKVTTYLQGLTFEPESIRLALVEASEGKLGDFWDAVKINCLTFDPTKGAYTMTAMTIMKIGGVATMIFLAVVITLAVRREKRRLGKPRSGELSPTS